MNSGFKLSNCHFLKQLFHLLSKEKNPREMLKQTVVKIIWQTPIICFLMTLVKTCLLGLPLANHLLHKKFLECFFFPRTDLDDKIPLC